MTKGRETTGTRDSTFDVVSILYHALRGAQAYDQYCADAIDSSDYELAKFFREVQEEERRRADRAKEMLMRVLSARSRVPADKGTA